MAFNRQSSGGNYDGDNQHHQYGRGGHDRHQPWSGNDHGRYDDQDRYQTQSSFGQQGGDRYRPGGFERAANSQQRSHDGFCADGNRYEPDDSHHMPSHWQQSRDDTQRGNQSRDTQRGNQSRDTQRGNQSLDTQRGNQSRDTQRGNQSSMDRGHNQNQYHTLPQGSDNRTNYQRYDDDYEHGADRYQPVGSRHNQPGFNRSQAGAAMPGTSQQPAHAGLQQGFGALTNTLGSLSSVAQMSPSRIRPRQMEGDKPFNIDISLLRDLSDNVKHILEKAGRVIANEPWNLLNGTCLRSHLIKAKKFDLEFVSVSETVEEDGEEKIRKHWLFNGYVDHMRMLTFDAPYGMTQKEIKQKCLNELINHLLNPSKLSLTKSEKKTSSKGREYSRELVISSSSVETVDYVTKYGSDGSDDKIPSLAGTEEDPLAHFVIFENHRINTSQKPGQVASHDLSVLHNSAQSNKVKLELVCSDTRLPIDGEDVWLWKVILGGELIGFGHDADKQAARHKAGSMAMTHLRKKCVTLKRNTEQFNQVDQEFEIAMQHITNSEATTTSRSQFDGPSAKRPIDESNVGHKMLKTMGWSGEGGLGKDGEGISQPIIPIDRIRNTGLGYMSNKSGINCDIVTRIMEDYLASDQKAPLVFSKELDRDERTQVHTLAHRFGMKSKSVGKNVQKYLFVFKRRSAQELAVDAARQAVAETQLQGYDFKFPEEN